MLLLSQQWRHKKNNIKVQEDYASVFVVIFRRVFPSRIIKFHGKQLSQTPFINVLNMQLMVVLLKVDLNIVTFQKFCKMFRTTPATLLKRDFSTVFSLWISRNFSKHTLRSKTTFGNWKKMMKNDFIKTAWLEM